MARKMTLTSPSMPDLADGSASPRPAFSASKVNRVVKAIAQGAESSHEVRNRWLSAVSARVTAARPDLAAAFEEVLGVGPDEDDKLAGFTIGEVGVCYEALLSLLDRDSRKTAGQFFTPDDAANFMAAQSTQFGPGVWLDPCCGVGNLAWHLSNVQANPSEFVSRNLILIDRDATALKSAVVLICADFAAPGDESAVRTLAKRAQQRDFLSRAALPKHDFTIVNPPYARAAERNGYETSRCRDLFAYFLERIAKTSRGYIAVTPASYLSVPKFAPLRDVIGRESEGGRIFVFDNVPDTLFRGYKYGSNNTSKTNFVRAAITVCEPTADRWRITPILRWQAADRARMFKTCDSLLTGLKHGPHGEWAKLVPGLTTVWESLLAEPETLRDLVSSQETDHWLDVGLTPRYYISATHRSLERGSKARLHFNSEEDRNRAAIVLNSSLPYLWWRALDGGVTLPRRVLLSVPMPSRARASADLLAELQKSEAINLVMKLNAGRENENVKHPRSLVSALDDVVLPPHPELGLIYASSMFPPTE